MGYTPYIKPINPVVTLYTNPLKLRTVFESKKQFEMATIFVLLLCFGFMWDQFTILTLSWSIIKKIGRMTVCEYY